MAQRAAKTPHASADLLSETAHVLSKQKSYGSAKHTSRNAVAAQSLPGSEQHHHTVYRVMDSDDIVSESDKLKPTDDVTFVPNASTHPQKTDSLIVTDDIVGKAKDDGVTENISRRKKRVLLVAMAIMDMSGGLLFGMIGPFYPTVALEKGATPLLSGIVLGSYEFTMIFAAPIMGNFIARIGVRYTYTAGIMLAGFCSILFGLLIYVPDNWFIPLCVVVRVLQGTGFAAFVTSTYAILVTLFTNEMAQIFGILETVKGAGFMIGPVVGSGLYALGGYIAPFVTMGVLILILGAAVSSFLPKYTESIKSEVSVWQLFLIPMEVVCGLIHAALAFMFANVDATMSLHLASFNLDQIYVGLLFFAMAAGYVVASPIVGRVTDKFPSMAFIMILVGFFLCACSTMLAGPVPFLPLPSDNLVLFSVSVVLVGLTAATAVVTFTVMFSVARLYNFPDNIDTYGKISGFVEGFYNSGAFIGPILGGLAYQNLGWQWSFPITGFIYLGCITLLFILLCWQKLFRGMNFTSGLTMEAHVDEDKHVKGITNSSDAEKANLNNVDI